MSSTVSCSSAAHSVSVSRRMLAQIRATPTGCTMNSSPERRRWSAWCSQANTNAAWTRVAVDLDERVLGVLLDDREEVAEQLALARGERRGDRGGRSVAQLLYAACRCSSVPGMSSPSCRSPFVCAVGGRVPRGVTRRRSVTVDRRALPVETRRARPPRGPAAGARRARATVAGVPSPRRTASRSRPAAPPRSRSAR